MREYERQAGWTRWHVAAVVLLLVVLLGTLLLIYRLTDNRPAGTQPSQIAAAPTPTYSTTASPAATSMASPTTLPATRPPAGTQAPAAAATPPPAATSAPPPAATQPPPPPAVFLPERLLARTVTDRLRVRSAPGVGEESTRYEPPLPEGTEFQIVGGPVYVSEYWWYSVRDISARLDGGVDEGWVASADHDGTPWIGPARDACLDFEFPGGAVTVETFDELQSGILGNWAGCVTTPWTPPYWVTFGFRDDGTYSSYAEVAPGGEQYPALYYGTDDESPYKQYLLDDLHDNGLGSGQIDVVWDVSSVNRDELENIAIMGDRLQFEFFHAAQYGPVEYRLYRQR